MVNDEILLRRDGHLGHIVLNRPKAINALTHAMVTRIAAALDDWEHDDSVATVLLTGAGERGLCAGGDIVAIHRDAVNHGTETERFWADEYRLNARIANYPKPYVALMDGLVLGGGVGLSAHGSLRVVTERTKVGMPETSIGFVPDVGGTRLLSHAPGELGTHVALTAAKLSGSDAIALGFADHFVDSNALPSLIRNLAVTGAQEAVQAAARDYLPPAALAADRAWIDACYAFDTVEEILSALRVSGVPAAQAAAESILAKSPTAVKVTLESLRRARTSESLAETLEQEYRVSLRCLAGLDLPEGIRAQVIGKDRRPQWSPATLEAVSAADVATYFADLGPHELSLATAVSGATARPPRTHVPQLRNTTAQKEKVLMSKRIAFIGLGHMGGPMAANLVKAGHLVSGFDLAPEALETARTQGIEVAASAAAAAAGADVVITMLPAGRHVLAAYRGEDGLLAVASPGTLFLECSTIAVEDARAAHELVAAAGHKGLDAPVSGGVGGAVNGTLTFMAGGTAEDFAEAGPVLAAMGARIVHCGGPGAGQAAKVCNNMILGISMIAVSEAFVLGEKLGLSNEALFDVASAASGQCWALTSNCPVPGPVPASPANRNYQPGFAGALMAKDLGLAAQALESTGVQARLGSLAEEIYRDFAAGEGAGRDFSGIITEIRANSKTKETV